MVKVFFSTAAAEQFGELAKRTPSSAERLLDVFSGDALPEKAVHRLNRIGSKKGIFSFRSDGLRVVFLDEKKSGENQRYVLRVYDPKDLSAETPEETDALLKAAVSVTG